MSRERQHGAAAAEPDRQRQQQQQQRPLRVAADSSRSYDVEESTSSSSDNDERLLLPPSADPYSVDEALSLQASSSSSATKECSSDAAFGSSSLSVSDAKAFTEVSDDGVLRDDEGNPIDSNEAEENILLEELVMMMTMREAGEGMPAREARRRNERRSRRREGRWIRWSN